MKIIGICGYAQIGKDTAFEELNRLKPNNFLQLAFASELKAEVNDMLDAMGLYPNFNNPDEKEFWRDMLVFWGRKRRQLDKNYWVEAVMRQAMGLSVDGGWDVIITDVRYANEVEAILAKGGMVIRLHKPGVGPRNQEEEISFEIIDREYPNLPVLTNDGTKEELGQKLLELLKC